MPIGFKNATDGGISSAVHAITTAREPHSFIASNTEGRSSVVESVGNPYCHLVLRGGEARTNYHPDTVADAMQALLEASLPPRLVIDCSHDNCRKIAERQPAVFQDVVEQVLGGNQNIVGAMLESNLEGGKASKECDAPYGVSLTDPCIDWQTTEELILWAHSRLSSSKKNSCWATSL
jgi:3-deoxy-7-phosphoheptulonate synthase